MHITPLTPAQPVPSLSVPNLDGSTWNLADQLSPTYTMVVFYRGRHCPACGTYLTELAGLLPEFTAAGVNVVAISCDGEEQARSAQEDWGLVHLTIGYGLSVEAARSCGLFISSGERKRQDGTTEAFLHSEPGLFLLRPDGTLFLSSVQSSPMGRPHLNDMVSTVRFLADKNFPPPGTVVS